MIVKFSEEFLKYTNFQKEIVVGGGTPRRVLQTLMNDYPQLYVFMVKDNAAEANKTLVKLNGDCISEPSELVRSVSDSDVLEFTQDIPSGEDGVAKVFGGAALAIIGAVTDQYWLVGMGMSMALGGVAELIAPQPMLPTFDSGNSTSATYTFSGIKNTTVLGTPVGVVYGTHRVGGHVLSAYNDVIGTESTGNTSWLRVQLGLCEGEIDYIDPASIEINGRRSSDFPASDIEVLYRTGTSTQTPPPAPIVTAAGASSEVSPPQYAYVTSSGWERTLELPCTSIELDIKAKAINTIYDVWYKVYYKEADSTGDYIYSTDNIKVNSVFIDAPGIDLPSKIHVVFPKAALWKIKVVEIIAGYTNSIVLPV